MGIIRGVVVASVIFVLAAAPSGFYSVPSPLPRAAPGSVIWARPLTAGSALTNTAANTLVLYHTASADGRDVAVSGVIAIPKGPPPPGGWPVISWAHGTTGNAPQCAPSRFAKPDSEQRFLDRWVSAGYAVVQTDYEGEGTPGVHPYFSGVSGAHDVTDIVRAARRLYPGIGDRWIAMGHSEGGTVAMFAAATANSWAPELHLIGAVSYAPGSDIPDFFGQMTVNRQPTPMLPLLGMMIEGIASTDPQVDLKQVLSPKGLALLPSLQSACGGTLMESAAWTTLPPDEFFLPGATSSRLMQDFIANDPSKLSFHVPVLIEQGTSDTFVPPENSATLRSMLCANGSPVDFDAVPGATHDSVLPLSYDRVRSWVADRQSGTPLSQPCRT